MSTLPKKLYQYRSINTAQQFAWLTTLMETGKIFCNSIKNFNDPLDSLSIMDISFDEIDAFSDELLTPDIIQKIEDLPIPSETGIVEFKHFYNEYLQSAFYELSSNLNKHADPSEAYKHLGIPIDESVRNISRVKLRTLNLFNERLNELFQIGGIACFTEDHENLPMWAHYANNHKGVCVMFDLDKLADEQIERITRCLFKVEYMDNLPNACKMFFDRLKKGEHISSGELIQDFRKKKLYSWHYEKEWRLLVSRMGFSKIHFHHGQNPPANKFDITIDYKNTLPYSEILSLQKQGKSILIVEPLNPNILPYNEYNKLSEVAHYAHSSPLGEIPSFLTDSFFYDFVKPSKIILGYNINSDVKQMIKKKGDELEIAVSLMKLDAKGLSENLVCGVPA